MRHRARFTNGTDGAIHCVIYRVYDGGRIQTLAISAGTGLNRSAALTAAYDAVDDELMRQQLREGILDE